MLKSWEDIHKISRNAFGEDDVSPPPDMFRRIQKKLFWTNIRLFIKAYSTGIALTVAGLAAITAVTFFLLNHSFHSDNSTKAGPGKQSVSRFHPVNLSQSQKSPEQIYNKALSLPEAENNYKKEAEINENVVSVKSNSDVVVKDQENEKLSGSTEIKMTGKPDENKPVINNDFSTGSPERQKAFQAMTNIPFLFIPVINKSSFTPLKNDYYRKKAGIDINLKLYGGVSLSSGNRNDRPGINNSEITAQKFHSDLTLCGTTGIAADLEINHWHFQIGMQYTCLQMNYSANNLLYNSRVDTLTYISGYDPHIDMFNYYHFTYRLDSVIHTVDSVYTTEYDTTYIPVYEHIKRQHYDTLKQAQWKEQFHLLELPLTIGYSVNLKNLEFTLNGGIILGYITATGFRTYSGNEGTGPFTAVSDYYQYKSLMLSGTVSLSAVYWTGRHIGLEVSPYYRRSFMNISSVDKKTTLGHQLFGLNAGIIYKF